MQALYIIIWLVIPQYPSHHIVNVQSNGRFLATNYWLSRRDHQREKREGDWLSKSLVEFYIVYEEISYRWAQVFYFLSEACCLDCEQFLEDRDTLCFEIEGILLEYWFKKSMILLFED